MGFEDAKVLRTWVSLVVQLYDDYTGRRITSPEVCVTAEDGRKPVRKQEGFLVFTNLEGPAVRLSAESALYQPQRLWVKAASPGQKAPCIKLRLKPGRCYPFPAGAAFAAGRMQPGDRVLLIPKDTGVCFRLLYDADKGQDALHIFHGRKQELEGKKMAVWEKGRILQIITLAAASPEGEEAFMLQEPLQEDCKKASVRLYPVAEAEADEGGEIFLAVGNLKEPQTMLLQVIRQGKRLLEYSFMLEPGKEHKIEMERADTEKNQMQKRRKK